MIDTDKNTDLLAPGPLNRSQRHRIGDHRRCPPGCKRFGKDDRIQSYGHDSMMQHGWAARIYPSPAEEREYLESIEGTLIVRNGMLNAFPWLRLED